MADKNDGPTILHYTKPHRKEVLYELIRKREDVGGGFAELDSGIISKCHILAFPTFLGKRSLSQFT